MAVYVDFLTVEDETHTLGPFERVVFEVGRGEIRCDGTVLAHYGDMFCYCDAVQYEDGTLQAITRVTLR